MVTFYPQNFMQAEKPSFARFGRSTNLATARENVPVMQTPSASVSPRPMTPVNDGASFSKTAGIFDVLVTVSLIALFFGLPIFFTGLTFQGIAFEKQLYFYFWLLVGLVSWASKGVITGEMRIRRTPLDIPLLAFWLFYCVSAVFSVDRWHSFWGFFGDPSRGVISVTALVLAYFLVQNHFTEKRFRLMFLSLLTSGFLVVLWSVLVVLQIRFLPGSIENFAPLSLIGTVSTLTVFLSLLLPLFMTGLFVLWQGQDMKKWMRVSGTILVLLGLVGTLFLLLALYSFVPWIVVLGGLGFFMIYILSRIVRPAEQWTWVPMLAFVLVLAFLMIGNNKLARATLPIEVAPNMNLSWQIAQESLKEHFISGVGPANYGYAFSLYRPLEYNQNSLYTMRFYQGNGLFFEAVTTIGVIGTVLLLLLWASFLSISLYLLTLEKQRNKIYSLGLTSASIMLLLAAFVAPFSGPLVLIGFLLASLSFATLLWEGGSEPRYLSLSLKAAPKFALALAFIFMVISAGVAFLFVFMGKVFMADLSAGKAVKLSASAPSSDSANLLLQSIRSYPQEGRYYTRLGQEYMALANVEAGKGTEKRDDNAVAFFVRESVRAGEQGKALMPNDVMASESLALLYENAGLYAGDALPKAQEMYTRASELEPHNPLYLVKLGQIKRTLGDAKEAGDEKTALYKEADKFFEQAISEKKDLALAYYHRSLTLSRLQNYDQAIETAKQSTLIEKNNLTYRYNYGVLYQVRDNDGDAEQAQKIFEDILSINEKLIDVRLSLGLLHEKEGRRELAVSEYRKILDLLPTDGEKTVQDNRAQIEKMIQNVQNGTGNINRTAPQQTPAATAPTATPAGPTQTTPPANPNESPLSGEAQ